MSHVPGTLMTAGELEALADAVKALPRNLFGMPLLEIGAGVGGSARRIATALAFAGNPAVLFTVDDCSMNRGRALELAGGVTQREALLRLTREYSNVSWAEMTSAEWLDQRMRGPYALVFIDGDHVKEAVRHDLAFADFLAPGGTLILHDYGVDVHGFGPSRAFDEWFATQSVVQWGKLRLVESLLILRRCA